MRTRPAVRRICCTIAATTTAVAAVSILSAPSALACTGIPVAVDGYGACVTPQTTTVYPGGVYWTPGVPKQYVNTPAVGPVPAQAFGTPIVPSEGVTVPPVIVQAVKVTPCTGTC